MTTNIQKQIFGKTLLRVIALMLVIGFSLTACNKDKEPDPIRTQSGTVTANAEGVVLFEYSRLNGNVPDQCIFTTNLPAPNNRFVVSIVPSESTGRKEISGLTAGQAVSWTVTVSSGMPANIGSGNFVHIVNN